MISSLRVTTVLSSRIAVSILLLLLGRQALAQADPLEQAIKKYIRNPEAADMFRQAVAHMPENPPVKSIYETQLAQSIEETAIAKRDHSPINQRTEVTFMMFKVWEVSIQFDRRALKGMEAFVARLKELDASAKTPEDTFLWKAIDETAAPAPSGDSLGASPSQPGAPAARPDAMLQRAVSTMPEGALKSQAQRLLYRINTDVQHALAQIFTEQARWAHADPAPLAQGMLSALAAHYSAGLEAPIGPVFIENLERVIRTTLIFPGAADRLADPLNTMTRHSRHYADVDWGPFLRQFAKERQSAYMDDNLGKMLAESMRSAMSATPSATPATAR